MEPAGPRPSSSCLERRDHQTQRHRPVRQNHLRPNRRSRQKGHRSPRRTRRKASDPRATLAIAWMLSKPYITSPIVGATKPNHLTDAAAALAVKLTPEEITSLEEPYIPIKS
ncbi:aldo/keto reductase [Tunturiibacter empetritectus]